MTNKSVSARGSISKPAKPRKDVPLFAHASRQWAKKVRGKMHYFGTWDDPLAAEGKWDREKQALLEGRDPDVATQGDSIGWLCNAFVESKNMQREACRQVWSADVGDLACSAVTSCYCGLAALGDPRREISQRGASVSTEISTLTGTRREDSSFAWTLFLVIGE